MEAPLIATSTSEAVPVVGATRPRFAVVVVSYRRPDALRATLAALVRQTVGRHAMEICVVDNGGSACVRSELASEVDHWLVPENNLGPGGGRNLGVGATTAPVLVFVDDDGIPAQDFVGQLDGAFERHPTAVAVRGRVVALQHPLLTTMAVHYDRGPHEQPDLLTLEGATAILRESFEAAGGYDATRTTHEGLELSGRLLDTSPEATIMYTPHAVLRHDFFKGVGQVLAKAERLAEGANRLHEDDDPGLLALKKRSGRLRRFDGRPRWARAVGAVGELFFHRAITAYRIRAWLRRRSSSR
jgi:glycosyltransferase involved in cell wall biosynthesis